MFPGRDDNKVNWIGS